MRAAAIGLIAVIVAACGKSDAGAPSSRRVRGSGPPTARQETARHEECADAGFAPHTLGEGETIRASGLRMLVLHPGTGTEHPALFDRVRVSFSGWTADGVQFDSSVPRGGPTLFTVSQVIPGWGEALQDMVVNEKRRLWVPARLAYGENPSIGMPAGDLTYEVELTEIVRAPRPPGDVGAVPKDATVRPSGLAYRRLSTGAGKVHPKETDTVLASYSGWTTDGLLFDSSRLRDGPGAFSVSTLIRGWREGLQLMVVGDEMRFWMPADLAYGEHPNSDDAPAGMLVFDVKLIEIR